MEESVENTTIEKKVNINEIERPSKRCKLSLEILPEKKISFFEEIGTEINEDELKPDDKFMQFVHQVDFLNTKKEEEEKKKHEKEKSIFDTEWEKSRNNVQTHLGRAQEEIKRFIDLILMLESGVHLSVVECVKPPLPEKNELEQYIYQITSKKKYLNQASSKLSEAAERLRKSVEQENLYFDSVCKLRTRWKIRSEYQISNFRVPLFTVNYSYDNDGSRLSRERNMDVNIIKNDDGDVQITMPLSNLGNSMLVGKRPLDDEIQVKKNSDEEDDEDESEEIKFRIKETPLNKIATGVDACHKLLSEAQKSLYVYEIFVTLTQAAIKCKNSFVQLLENEIKLETNSSHPFSIKLLSSTQKLDTKDIVQLPLEERIIFTIIEIKLHQLLLRKYGKQQQEDYKIRYSKDFNLANEVDLEGPVLQEAVELYKHLRLFCQVRVLLHRLCLSTPRLTVNWIDTFRSSVASCDLIYDNSMTVAITIFQTKITLTNVELFTISDLEQYISHLISQFVEKQSQCK